MNPPREQIKLADPDELAGVRSFYSSVGYGGGVHPGDRVLAAWANRTVIAAARLCTEEGTLVLRGMYVTEDHRGLGVGSRLLRSISDAIGSSECWCVPYSHLIGFYAGIGFRVCERETIPSFLAARHRRYAADGKKVVIMKRAAMPPAGSKGPGAIQSG